MKFDTNVSAKSKLEIDQYAAAWRYALKIEAQFAPDLARTIENGLPELLGDDNFRMRIETPTEIEFEAYTVFDPNEIVFAPGTYSRLVNWDPRARFTAAHEIGHLVMHHSVQRPRLMSEAFQFEANSVRMSAEWQANHFAAAFLMPEELLRAERLNVHEVSALFRVSERAAELRLKELGLLPKRELPDFVKSFLGNT